MKPQFLPLFLLVPFTLFATDFQGAKVVSYFGYDDSIELKNDHCRVVITPSFGGKVMHYSRNGENILMVDESEEGWLYNPEQGNRTFNSGGRFDLGPQGIFPNIRLHTVGQWKGYVIDDRKALLVSQTDPATGLQLYREFTLAKDSSRLRIYETMINNGDQTLEFNYWCRTFAKGHGIVIVPLSKPSFYTRGYAFMSPEGLIYHKPVRDPHVWEKDGYVIIDEEPKLKKMGFDSNIGWMAYLMQSNDLFVKEYPVFTDRPYIDLASGTASVYYSNNFHGHELVELEPMGPKEVLNPGERGFFWEEWSLLEYPFPEDPKTLQPSAVYEHIKSSGLRIIEPTID